VTPTARQRVEAALVRLGFAVMRALGPVRASNLGGAVARAIGPLLPVSRIADINLRLAMPGLDAAGRRRIVRASWETLGRTVCELPHIPDLRETPSGPGWEIEGADVARWSAAHPGPLIFFSGHLGNWEMSARVAGSYGIALSSAYRAPDNPLIADMVTALRRRTVGRDVPMFPKGAQGARGALMHLAKGGKLGLVMDQKMNDGIPVAFFGHTAMTAPALAAFALRFRCPVVPVYARRIGPARFRMIVEEPVPLPDGDDRQAAIAALTRTVNETLERWIRGYPEGWLWLHRRWPKELYRRARASGTTA
jgi:Kdo2-lipid IVA lauroyltransferase/acyltransferase